MTLRLPKAPPCRRALTYARPWVDDDAEAVPHEFVCECGDPGCDEYVLMPLGALSRGPVLAPRR